jgi:putative ABC transport system permease protein
MTLVLLVAAGLLLQTIYRLRYADLGLKPERLLTLRTGLPLDRYPEHWRRVAFYDQVLDRVARLPGVVALGYTTSVPLEWKGGTSGFTIEGQAPDPRVIYDANHREVSAGYLQAIGIPLRAGRFLDARDRAGSQPVLIINDEMARKYWPGGDPIGKRIALDQEPDHWLTIVGVVGSVRQMGLDVPPRAELYIPYPQISTQPWFAPRDLVVRTLNDPTSLAAAITREIHAVDPSEPVSNVRTLDAILDEDVAARRATTALLTAFATFALLLAMVGIYGVIAYFVAQHIPEMGVRIALGAEPVDIVRLVVSKGVRLAVYGIAAGAAATLVAARLMSSLLYGVSATDLTGLAVASALLVLLALLASYLPARRAMGVDPIVALRTE